MSFPGVKTSRDDLVVDIDRDRLEERMRRYFDPDVSDEEMARLCPVAMASQQRFPAREVRRKLIQRGFLPQNIVRYSYRPFDLRWLYWEPETKLLDEKRADYRPHVFPGNCSLVTQQKPRRRWSPAQVISSAGCLDLMDRGATCVPRLIRTDGENGHLFLDLGNGGAQVNLSELGRFQAEALETDPEDLFFHALATLHSPAYRRENRGALRQDWPRVPLPATGERLRASAELGRRLAALLDPEQEAPGVAQGEIRLELRPVAVISVPPGQRLDPERDLAVTAGWGHAGKNGVTMPGKGELRGRPYDGEEQGALEAGAEALGVSAEQMLDLLGETTFDIHLGGKAFWRNVPEKVWAYTLGGYPVIKKWLSYREAALLGRPLRIEEVREVTAMARRIAAILLLEPRLDEVYREIQRESRAGRSD